MRGNTPLTRREAEVAELLAWGAAKKEVSDRLFISTRTVENTARNIYAKIGIQKATELCVWWFCTQCGVSFELSPIKRAIAACILIIAFSNSHIFELRKSERYYRRNAAKIERVTTGRIDDDDDTTTLITI
ncbi:MAG: helix-turn-helix transcriptional regulator [Bacteroidales bacterium]|jgi:DNA-binding CsgD family transcriptional regulator|nr:helix-turn-helix transcriptional regulator [Bacteroidales bacterium]